MVKSVSDTDSTEKTIKVLEMYSIGDLARATECHIESIRQYERKGLLKKPPRTQNGHRRYTDQHVSVLRLIRQFRRADFSLNEIKAIIDQLNASYAPCGRIEVNLLAHSLKVEEKRKELDRCEQMLEDMAQTCIGCHKAFRDTIIDDCPLVQKLSAQGEETG